MIQGYTYHMPGKVWMRRIADAVLVILFMLSLAWCFWYYTIGAPGGRTRRTRYLSAVIIFIHR